MLSDPPTRPLPLTDRITIAWDQLRIARVEGDPNTELGWESVMNRLVDKYIGGER